MDLFFSRRQTAGRPDTCLSGEPTEGLKNNLWKMSHFTNFKHLAFKTTSDKFILLCQFKWRAFVGSKVGQVLVLLCSSKKVECLGSFFYVMVGRFHQSMHRRDRSTYHLTNQIHECNFNRLPKISKVCGCVTLGCPLLDWFNTQKNTLQLAF